MSANESQPTKSIVEALSGAGSWRWDPATDTVEWSPAIYEIFGFERDEVEPTFDLYLSRVHDADRERVRRTLERTLATGEPFRHHLRMVRTDGAIRSLETAARVELDEQGNTIALSGACIDVTERERARQDLHRREAELRLALSAARMGTWRWALDSGVMSYSPESERLFGLHRGAFGGTYDAFRDLVVPDDRHLLDEALQRALRSSDGRYTVKYRVVHPLGDTRWMRTVGHVERDADGRVVGLVGTVADISDLVGLEQQFLQAQKLESVGRLAGGVAHDFNNLLTVFLSQVELIETAQPTDPDVAEASRAIRDAVGVGARLTQQLLTVGRQQHVQPEIVLIDQLIRERSHLLTRLLGERVELRVTTSAPIWPVEIDVSQLNQVLLNLAVNASEAMVEGGTLSVDVRNTRVPYDSQDVPPLEPGDYVVLTFSDTGIGIPEGILDHVFEPFFSTKPTGSGLGLSTSYGIVRKHGGEITLDSAEGEGATVRVFLPRASSDAPAAVDAREETALARVLLVEDNDALRTPLARALRNRNYDVAEARDGEDALARFDPAGIDVLVTDLMMPRTGGVELVEKMRASVPDLPVLMVTGYAASAGDEIPDGVVLVHKPFGPASLVREIEALLGL